MHPRVQSVGARISARRGGGAGRPGISLVLAAVLFCVLLRPAAAQLPEAQPAGLEGATRQITTGDLVPVFKAAIHEFAPWPADDIEIGRVEAYPSKTSIPAGHLDIEMEPPPNGRYLGRVSMLATIRVNGEVVRRIRICGWVEVYRPVLCSSRAMAKGHVLRAEDFNAVRRPLSRLRGHSLDDPGQALGLALTRSVQAGQVITDRLLTPPVMIRRGDRVIILARSPALTISVPGEAKQDGARGDFVKIRNLMSQREILARVVDARTVAVSF